jgi:aryl-alcohol dehydrogenase-like predicted oxidoreductase
MNRIGGTDLEVFPLCLGGNVFGWTADEAASFAVLDAPLPAGRALVHRLLGAG